MDTDSITEQAAKTDYFSTEHLNLSVKRRALRGASLTITGQLSSFIIQTTGTIVLARLLTPYDFGLITMVISISLLLQGFGANGFVEAVVQRQNVNHQQISTLFWINAALSFSLMLLFIAAAPVIAWFYNEPRLKTIVLIIAGSIFFGGLSNQHVSILTRNMQFLKTTLNEVLAALISITSAIVLALYGYGYWALAAKWLISPLMITIGAWMMCGWRPGLPSRGSGVRPLLRFAFHTYGNFVMSYFRRNIDKILIGRTFGSQSLGYYDRAYHLSNMLPVQMISPLNSVSLAAFSRLTDDRAKYQNMYLKVLSILAFVGMPMSSVLTVVSYDVILLLMGPQWSKAGQIFRVFGPSIGIAIIYITHGWLHLSLGTPDRWLRWSIVEFIFTLLAFLIGLQFGTLGVAVAFSVTFYVLLGPALWYAGKPIQLKLTDIFLVLWKYYLAAFASGLVSWFFLQYFEPTALLFINLHILARIIVSSLICISLYMIFIIIAFRSLQPIVHVITVLKEMLRQRSGE